MIVRISLFVCPAINYMYVCIIYIKCETWVSERLKVLLLSILVVHVFTKQSSVENCYQLGPNYNAIVSNKKDVNPGGHPDPHHTRYNITTYNNTCCYIITTLGRSELILCFTFCLTLDPFWPSDVFLQKPANLSSYILKPQLEMD